ncbi:cache domain-containing protein [Leucobacter sp. wl10]|uniref:cache domain-containing protein n=1 Tax=Leucobacter sp. wl10 TaxID=2304677 RepID=UPI000E5C3E15|nr:cache domain-containing protein [Leucobacter sp. wl10]RGE23304.1 hypothetical protein D1J51_03480 [Leucobacter sp. wl10]
MSTQAVRDLGAAMDAVDEFFDGVFAPLEAWLPRLTARMARQLEQGRLTGAQLAALVEPDAHRILDTADRPLYGAGYCASELLVSEGNPLAWWQGPERSLLASSTFGPGQAAIDLVRLEWYRVPRGTGRRHVAGPFVDYLCSNEITITSSIPVLHENRFLGVICADVLVASLENALLPQAGELAEATLVNAGGRVVVSNDPAYETGDRLAEAVFDGGIGGLPGSARVARSDRYPFALVASE